MNACSKTWFVYVVDLMY